MKKQTTFKLQTIAFAAFATLAFMFAAYHSASAQGKFKPGDRVECDSMEIDKYEKGTVLPYGKYDHPPTSYYRVRLDRNPTDTDGTICRIERIRALAATAINENQTETNTRQTKTTGGTQQQTGGRIAADKNGGELLVDENNTVLADRELLNCDNIEQKPVKNGARPDAKLLEKLIRCLWERPSEKGLDGARTVDLTPLQIGAPRKWVEYKDIGSGGNANTTVYPVKTTYTWRTFYRSKIQEIVSVGVFNCYVDTFGEWKCGLSDSKQKGETKDIPVQQ